jgi:hypothetical protein
MKCLFPFLNARYAMKSHGLEPDAEAARDFLYVGCHLHRLSLKHSTLFHKKSIWRLQQAIVQATKSRRKAMTAYGGSRCIGPRFLDLGTRWR